MPEPPAPPGELMPPLFPPPPPPPPVPGVAFLPSRPGRLPVPSPPCPPPPLPPRPPLLPDRFRGRPELTAGTPVGAFDPAAAEDLPMLADLKNDPNGVVRMQADKAIKKIRPDGK